MKGRRDGLASIPACLLLTLGIWVNTGTLAPMGATLAHPYVWQPCQYLLNIDHFHHKATFLMLDGAPRRQWEFSVVLRRILYPLIAYPFMKVFGFGGGGLVVNVLLSCAALVVFWRELQRRLEHRAPAWLLGLLATYPGWFYWTGTPYQYAAIVPASLLAMTLLWRLETAAGWRATALIGLGLGVLFTAYDLLPFFGAAALSMLLWRRRWTASIALALAQLVPTLVANLLLYRLYGVALRNANSEAYWRIVGSYLPPYDWPAWRALLVQLPHVLVDDFLFSNFLVVPLLFILALALARFAGDARAPALGLAETCLLLVTAALFLFNNVAPPYAGWQLRGLWIARLYQPLLPALLSAIAAVGAQVAAMRRPPRVGLSVALALALSLHVWVVFAPVLGQPTLTGWLDFRFYRHAPRPVYAENLRRYGIRPIGFCSSQPSSDDSVTH